MNDKLRLGIIYFLLSMFGLFMIIPFIWMISTALMTQSEFNKTIPFLSLKSVITYGKPLGNSNGFCLYRPKVTAPLSTSSTKSLRSKRNTSLYPALR